MLFRSQHKSVMQLPSWSGVALGLPGRTLIFTFAWITNLLTFLVGALPEGSTLDPWGKSHKFYMHLCSHIHKNKHFLECLYLHAFPDLEAPFSTLWEHERGWDWMVGHLFCIEEMPIQAWYCQLGLKNLLFKELKRGWQTDRKALCKELALQKRAARHVSIKGWSY